MNIKIQMIPPLPPSSKTDVLLYVLPAQLVQRSNYRSQVNIQ